MFSFNPNPIALRTAKTLWSFGHSQCNRVKSLHHFGRVSPSRVAIRKSQGDLSCKNGGRAYTIHPKT